MKNTFPYKTAFVTGASSGLGAALCRLLVDEGLAVFGTSRDPSRIDMTGVVPVPLNLSDMEAVGKFASGRLQEMQIDLLVNCAGCGVFSSYCELPEAQIQDQLNVMLHAPALLCREALPFMLSRGNGCIVNVSSLAVRFPLPCMATYNMTKAGLSALSVSLMDEMRGKGVCIIDFQPGDFNSGFMASTRRLGGTDGAWNAATTHLEGAPSAEAIARKLVKFISMQKSATIAAGSFFQSKLAPLGQKILPECFFRMLRRFYTE